MIPTPTGRARARSARARAPPRLYSLAGLRLTMLLLLLPCCSSRCSCSGLSSFPMLLRLFFRLQCSTLFSLSRFPFHDSQVYFWMKHRLGGAPGRPRARSMNFFEAPEGSGGLLRAVGRLGPPKMAPKSPPERLRSDFSSENKPGYHGTGSARGDRATSTASDARAAREARGMRARAPAPRGAATQERQEQSEHEHSKRT